MKIICTQENLHQGLAVAGHLTNKNVNLPILNNVLMEIKNNSIKLSSTNLEIGVSCLVRGKVEAEGGFTVESKLLADYVSLLPASENVEMELVKDDYLNIKCKNNNTRIKGLNPEDFPVMPQINREQPYTLKAKDFRAGLAQVIFAVSVSETRPEISGVYMNFDGQTLTLAGTDSYRLAEKKISLINAGVKKEIIVPVKALQEVQRILGIIKESQDNPENIEIHVSENQILFVIGNVELLSRLVEGQYPDYQQIIPKQANTKTIASTQETVKIIKTIALFSKAGIYDINIEFQADSKSLVFSSNNIQIGESVSELSVEFEGQQNATTMNYRFLLEGLNNIDAGEFSLEIIDANIPCIIRPKADDSYLYIVMPIKQ